MASKSHQPPTRRKQHPVSAALHTLAKVLQLLAAFWTKFNNDWAWNNAAGLAYNLILAVFPLIITLLSILGFFLSTLDPVAFQSALDKITSVSSALATAKPIVAAALQQVRKDAGLLGALAIVLALFNGSRLFIFMESCLDIIYHVRPRGILAQNLMSIVMLLLFVVIFPIAVLTSAAPAFVFSLLQKTSFSQVPGSNLVFGLGGMLGGLVAWYMLFQVIYMVVPNQKISFRESWLGAVVAAVLLEIYLALFPPFVAHFLGIFAGTLGLLILLIFFYYFALILFLGAEVNAFFAQGVRDMPHDLVTMVHMMTSHLPTSEEGIKE
jgi:membrane protein